MQQNITREKKGADLRKKDKQRKDTKAGVSENKGEKGELAVP